MVMPRGIAWVRPDAAMLDGAESRPNAKSLTAKTPADYKQPPGGGILAAVGFL